MATLRNKRKLEAVTSGTKEEHPRNGQSQNTSVLRINEEYITQLFEQIESRVTKKLSQKFSRTESFILGALSKLDEFPLNPQIRTHSGTVPGTFRNTNVENQGTNGKDSQSDPHPEVGIFHGQTTQNSAPKDCRDMVTGVQEEVRYRPHMVPEIQEKIPCCSVGISSEKQKKAHSTSQPPFRSENTPAIIEADQILLALQQVATNNNSAVVNNNNNRISKLPKSLPTTMRTFNRKSEKCELFEDLFQMSLKIYNQLTEENKMYYFHSVMRGDALQTFKNFSNRNRENLTEILTVFRRKYVKPQSMATAKHNF